MDLSVVKNGKYLEIKKNGKTCKYDLSTGEFIGFSGKAVKGLHAHLYDIHVSDFIDAIQDENYRYFIHNQFEKERNGRKFKVASLLKEMQKYSAYEQYYAVGLHRHFNLDNFNFKLSEVLPVVVKLVKKFNLFINNDMYRVMKEHLGVINALMEIDISIYPSEYIEQVKHGLFSRRYDLNNGSCFTDLVETHLYDVKSLINYGFRLWQFEGIEISSNFWNELRDYAKMMGEMSTRKWEKYPGHFLTTHRITARNYTQQKIQHDEEQFKATRIVGYNYTYRDWIFIYPEKTDDIKDEGCQQNNCVASYIKRIIDGQCHIVFMRQKNDPDKSRITVEIQNHKPVQCLRTFNKSLSDDEQKVINKYTAYLEKKFLKKEGDESTNVDKENVA